MEMDLISSQTVLRSGSVAPTCSRHRGELRPQGFAPFEGNDYVATGDAGMASRGYRPWSPPIT